MIDKLTEWLKLSPRHIAAIAVACGVYVALREPQLERLGLDALDGRIRPWVGAGLILSSSLLLVHAIAYIRSQFSARLTARRRKQSREQRLHELSPEEQLILAVYFHGNTKTVPLDISSGIVNGLAAAGVITLASSVSSSYLTFDFNIQPWALEYIRVHPDVLGELQNPDSDDALLPSPPAEAAKRFFVPPGE